MCRSRVSAEWKGTWTGSFFSSQNFFAYLRRTTRKGGQEDGIS